MAEELLAWAACLSWPAPRLPWEEEMYVQVDFRNKKYPQDQVLSVLPRGPVVQEPWMDTPQVT